METTKKVNQTKVNVLSWSVIVGILVSLYFLFSGMSQFAG